MTASNCIHLLTKLVDYIWQLVRMLGPEQGSGLTVLISELGQVGPSTKFCELKLEFTILHFSRFNKDLFV